MTKEAAKYQGTEMEKKLILSKLREKGCRITKQRMKLIDTILENDCASCKEIYYMASANDSKLGIATVYRMVNLLEEIGVISRRNMYAISDEVCPGQSYRRVILDDGTVCCLTEEKWNDVIRAGLKAQGYLKEKDKSTHKEDGK